MGNREGEMIRNEEIHASLQKAREFVFEGGNQIMTNCLDEYHGVSVSPGATALATLALLALGSNFEVPRESGSRWLWKHREAKGWGKYPGDNPDAEVSRLVQTVIQGGQGGWLGRIVLLGRARKFAEMILSLGQRVVPGLEGPHPNEITLPNILDKKVLSKLPPYGRPVVVAAALLAASNGREGVNHALEYLRNTQMNDGSWSEDTVATSMSILALTRFQNRGNRTEKAGQWLVRKQYPSGAWPAFDQLHTWAMGWAINILGSRNSEESEWLIRAGEWLRNARNYDGSYGTTPPFTHPDLDDTAVALMGLQRSSESEETVRLLKLLQNEDGSWGTFPDFEGVPPKIKCQFPVYITSADVTIHALEALWLHRTRSDDRVLQRGLNWLLSQQKPDGEMNSVWYEGPIYTTAQMAELLSKWKYNWQEWKTARQILAARNKTQEFLLAVQNGDGSWGGSVVETALALSALWRLDHVPKDRVELAAKKLLEWQKADGSFISSYRGVYAKGWNYEEPLTTALTVIQALERTLLG